MTALGLPDPGLHGSFYDDVPTKRFLAWIVDILVILSIALLLTPLTAFSSLFFFPLFLACIGFAYRIVTLARGSATWGMRLMAIELRDGAGDRFDLPHAVLHTVGYSISIAIFPLQLISAVLMLSTPRGQGLTDHVIGSAAINRAVE